MKVFLYDLDKCNGCHNCQIACKDEHVGNDWSPYALPQPDTGQFWCKVDEEVCGSVPHVRVNYLPHQCNHCDDAPCIAVAPEAVHKRDDGLVLIDPDAAKDLRSLVDSCPYGAIFWNEELGLPQKCTGCAHLLDDGWAEPRCVDACCTGALRFGEEEDFAEELARAEVLLPQAGTRPRVHYLNKPKRFIAITMVDVEGDEVVEGAAVTLQRAEGAETVSVLATDEFGDAWFENLAPDCYRLRVQKEGYLDLACSFDVTEKDQAVAEMRFYRVPIAI
ncbi:4Fe-4S dicluster domain-containing protein [Gordonibacter sp.]|uniref:4Fe-4S dicluster domain-containing protein n=1 Tax=Gordonibacter sp. TaxID=1968902 RepID=UPI002FC9EEF7